MRAVRYIGVMEQDDRLKEEKDIIIYGAGKVGRHALEVLREKGLGDRVKCFCDRNPALYGGEAGGVPVCLLSEAYVKYPEGSYLIASMSVRQMMENLLQYGIGKIHIIRES